MKLQIKVFIILFIFSAQSGAFDRQRIVFENETNKEKVVVFEFDGVMLAPALDLFSKKETKHPEIRKISDFFKRFYEINKNGSKQDVLLLWESGERSKLDKEITNEIFESNRL